MVQLSYKECLCIKATSFQNLVFYLYISFCYGVCISCPTACQITVPKMEGWYNYLQVKLSFSSSPLFDFLILFPSSLVSCIKMTCCKYWWKKLRVTAGSVFIHIKSFISNFTSFPLFLQKEIWRECVSGY